MDHIQRPLYDTWLESGPRDALFPWAVQLIGYVAHFDSEESAKRYIAGVEAYRKQFGKGAA